MDYLPGLSKKLDNVITGTEIIYIFIMSDMIICFTCQNGTSSPEYYIYFLFYLSLMSKDVLNYKDDK